MDLKLQMRMKGVHNISDISQPNRRNGRIATFLSQTTYTVQFNY